MNEDIKLKQLRLLRPGDGLHQVDYNDIQGWLRRAGPTYDVSVLCDLDRERINSIFERFFEPVR